MNAHVQVGGTFLRSWQFVSSQVEQRSAGLVAFIIVDGLHNIELLSFKFSYRKFNHSFENTQSSNFFVVIILLQ